MMIPETISSNAEKQPYNLYPKFHLKHIYFLSKAFLLLGSVRSHVNLGMLELFYFLS